MKTQKPANERHWPGTVRIINEVEWMLLCVVQRQAAQNVADDLIASGPDELMEDGHG
jgi:hypothetical protein